MKVVVNEESVELADSSTLADLCAHLGLQGRAVVISVDGELVPRGEYGRFVLQEASRVEVMELVGGG